MEVHTSRELLNAILFCSKKIINQKQNQTISTWIFPTPSKIMCSKCLHPLFQNQHPLIQSPQKYILSYLFSTLCALSLFSCLLGFLSKLHIRPWFQNHYNYQICGQRQRWFPKFNDRFHNWSVNRFRKAWK